MATCKHVTLPARAVEEELYILRLTREEAITLRLVCHRISGHPDGRRGDMANIVGTLAQAGVPLPVRNDILEHSSV